jgi:ASC-1-like (ASCH) protein
MTGGKNMKNKKHRNTKLKNKIGREEMTTYVEHLSEPWFTLILMGKKTVEGRKNKGKFKEMNVGDIIEWFNDDFEHRSVKTRIIEKVEYKTFEEYLTAEGLENCLPAIPSMSHGLSVYFKYFTKEDEEKYGVIAIRLELL